MNMNRARVTATAHTGVTVSDIDRSIAFYRDVLGFEVTEKVRVGGRAVRAGHGRAKAEIDIAYVKAPGHTLELLQYTSPADRTRVTSRPCDPGALHWHSGSRTSKASSRHAARQASSVSPTIPEHADGPAKGLKGVYTTDPDGS